MKKCNFTCPSCNEPIKGFYVPGDQAGVSKADARVCRCPHCHGDIDDQVQSMLDLIIQEEELKDWLWEERLRLVRSMDTLEDVLALWEEYPPPAEP
jgi:hypothetical protein